MADEPISPSVAEDALRGMRDRQMASWVCSTLWLVGQTEPEALARAIGQVFDVKAAEAEARKTLANVQKMREQAAFVIRELFAMKHEFEDLKKAIERDLDQVSISVENLHRRLDRAGKLAAQFLPKDNDVRQGN